MDEDAIRSCYLEVLGREPDPASDHYRGLSLSACQLKVRLQNSVEFAVGSGSEALVSLSRFLDWPHLWYMCLPAHRVLYAPIPKNASTRLKRFIVSISAAPLRDELLRGDTNLLLDTTFTGLQVMDLSHGEIREAFTSSDYLRMAVVRDPVRRLVSAYWEKFVVNRRYANNRAHADPVARSISKSHGWKHRAEMKASGGPTFREFVNYLERTDPTTLDPHWRPQSHFLTGVDWTLVVGSEKVEWIEQELLRRCHEQVGPIEQISNITGSGRGRRRSDAADLRPRQLARIGPIASESFVDAEVRRAIHAVYEDDFDWYERRTR
jgi:hypothetical protein